MKMKMKDSIDTAQIHPGLEMNAKIENKNLTMMMLICIKEIVNLFLCDS